MTTLTKILIFTVLIFFIGVGIFNSYAYRIAKPIPITEINPTTLVELNNTLEELWDITNGRMDEIFKLNIGDVPDGNYMETQNDGDVIFHGTSGLAFGNCYGNHIGWSQASAAEDTWYNISDTDMSSGQLNNVTHDGSGKLTVINAGMYLIGYSICFEDDAANDHIEAGIEVSNSGSAEGAGQAHLENKFSNEEEHMSSSTILDLAANATIEIAIRTTDTDTPTIAVQAVNITCVMIGG